MTGLYLFAAAAGVPLLAWSLFGGGDDAGGEHGGDDGGGVGGIMLRLLPLSTIAIVAAAFGACGLVLGAAGAGSGTTFLGALAVAVVAGVLNSTVFAYLRRTESTTASDDERLVGSVGRVVLPVAIGRRGRIAVVVGGQQLYLSAQALPTFPGDTAEELDIGAPVLVVEVRDGIAGVTRLAPELT
jgi:hypothetical protein